MNEGKKKPLYIAYFSKAFRKLLLI